MVDRWADRRAGRASGAMPHARRASMPARASASPDEVWRDERVQALSATAQVVEEVNDVWRHTVPGLARCAEEVEPLLRQAHGIGAAVPAEHLRQLQAQVSWLRGQAPRDPI